MRSKKGIKKEPIHSAQKKNDLAKDQRVKKKKIVYRSYTLGRRMGLR